MKNVPLAQAKSTFRSFASSSTSRTIVSNLLYIGLGFVVSKGVVFGRYFPFGVAFLASAPYESLWPALFGVIAGHAFSPEIPAGIRYITTAISVCAVRWALSDLKKLQSSPYFAPLLGFLPTFATGLAILGSGGSSLLAMFIVEGLLAGASAYFFKETFALVRGQRSGISSADLVSASMTFCIGILSLSAVSFWSVSVGHVLAILTIFFCAQYLGVTGGSIAGIVAGLVFGLTTKTPTHLAAAYSFGGLASGLVAPFGKFPVWLVFLASTVVVSAQTGSPVAITSSIYEVLTAAVVFILLPNVVGYKFLGFFHSSSLAKKTAEPIDRAILSRLDFTASALEGVSNCVAKVSQKLRALHKNTEVDIFKKARETTCTGCSMHLFCHENSPEATRAAIESVSEILQKNGQVSPCDFPSEFEKRCCKNTELAQNLSNFHREELVKKLAAGRIDEVQAVVSAQFAETGQILADISHEFGQYENFDEAAAERVSQMLKSQGIVPLGVSCRRGKAGRYFVEVETFSQAKEIFETGSMVEKISNLCKVCLDSASVSCSGDRLKVQLAEKAQFTVKVGMAQHVCKNGLLCGDNFTHFEDGAGHAVVILSDGMGTGGRAAVEGAMACQILATLLRAGLSAETAIKITNSALLIKSNDEYLATLDILRVNLFTGQAQLYKAGAPVTFVKKNGKVDLIEHESLPIGILNDLVFATTTENFADGDKILLISDGAVADDDRYISEEMGHWQGQTPEIFARHIVERAVGNLPQGYDDDITAIAVEVCKTKA